MTAPDTTKNRLIKSSIVAILLLCLCVAALGLLGIRNDIDLIPFGDTHLLLLALVTQIIASLLFIHAWQSVTQLQTAVKCSFAECAAHIGVTLLGKYLPGKIWGLLGRSYLLTRRGLSTGLALNLLLADQYVTFYTGILLGISALIAFYHPWLGFGAVLAGGLIFPVSLHYYDQIMRIAARLLRALTRKISQDQQVENSPPLFRFFYRAFLAYSAHWLLTAAVLGILFYPAIANSPVAAFTIIIAAIPLAMLLGFIAVWAPGGIGVREGTIVAILALQFPVDFALTIAIYYRIICVAIDLVLGAFATLYLLKISPHLLDPASSR